MDKMINTSEKSLCNKQYKDTAKDQFSKVFKAFFEQPRTMKEADFESGVMRENICRYVKMLRDENKIVKLKKRYCTRTQHRAFELTTNPDLFPKPQPEQLRLFD